MAVLCEIQYIKVVMFRWTIAVAVLGLAACGPTRRGDVDDSSGTQGEPEEPDEPKEPDEHDEPEHDEHDDEGGLLLAYAVRSPSNAVRVVRVWPDGKSTDVAAFELSIASPWSGDLKWSTSGKSLLANETEHGGSRIVVWSSDGSFQEVEHLGWVGDAAWFATEDGLVAHAEHADDFMSTIVVIDLRDSSTAATEVGPVPWKSCALVTPDAGRLFFNGPDFSLQAGRLDRSVPGMPVVDVVNLGLSAAACDISPDGRWLSAFGGDHAHIIPISDDVAPTSVVNVGTARNCEQFAPLGTWAPTESLFVFRDSRVVSGELCQGSVNDQWTQDLWLVDLRGDHIAESVLVAHGGDSPTSAAVPLGWQATRSGASRLAVSVSAPAGGRELRIVGFDDGIDVVGSTALPAGPLWLASLAPGAEAIVFGVRWGPDAELFVAASPSWTPRTLGRPVSTHATCVWSPDGAHVLCPILEEVGGELSHALWSFTLRDGSPVATRVDHPDAPARWPMIASFSSRGELLTYVDASPDVVSERLQFVPFEPTGPVVRDRFSLDVSDTIGRVAWSP
jgi:hypothetical protein